jgi:phage shock protein E
MKQLTLIAILLFTITACGNSKKSSSDATNSSDIETQTPKVITLSQANLAAKMAEDSVIVIDVRTPEEVSEGHIKGAHQFIDVNGSSFETEIGKLDKSKTYIMYCRSGSRSGRASEYMVENGFTSVYNLEGGITNYTGEIAK